MRIMQAIGMLHGHKLNAGGPGSGRHPGTGMTHQEFGKFAEKIGQARNANRDQEDKLRAQDRHDEANKIYTDNKVRVKSLLDEHKVTPKGFDAHMKDYAKAYGVRTPNVKMAQMFRD